MRDEPNEKGAERSAPFLPWAVFLGPRDKPEDDGWGMASVGA